MENVKTLAPILEVQDAGDGSLDLSLETKTTTSGIAIYKNKISEKDLANLVKGKSVVVETHGELDIAGSEFIALYSPNKPNPFYIHK